MYRDLIALRLNLAGTTGGLTSENVNVFHVDEQNKILAQHLNRWALVASPSWIEQSVENRDAPRNALPQ
jgi:hypothetical protein